MQEVKPHDERVVLLVDDDQFLRDMYALKFKERGFAVETAQGGTEAIDRLKGGLTPSIILFDLVMPGVDGFEFLTALRDQQLAPGAAKIALSNQGGDTDKEKVMELGAAGYIIKANTIPSEVVSQVVTLVDKK
jgi:two-component system chemotaxis response regulator CheY